jgi:hypothetical protein
MPLTNKYSLPMPILKAIETIREDYTPGDADFTATELISPPKLNALKKKYKDQIEEDASDLIRSVEGVALHYILERGGKLCPGYLGEQRHKAQFGPYTVSAQFDCLWLEGGVLTDWKRTTTYKCEKDFNGQYKPNKEWAAQLNIQAEILRRACGYDIRALQIGAFLRDWQPTKAMKDELYPQQEIITIPQPLAPPEYTERYILERCMLHEAAKKNVLLDGDDSVAECSVEERWQDPTMYAVMKKGRKTALKRCGSPEEAQAMIAQSSDADQLWIEERPSIARRCAGVGSKVYCSVRQYCHHWRGLSAAYAQQQAEVAE